MNHILRKFCAHHTVPWADKRSFVKGNHCVKSTGIRGFSGSYFPAFRLNTEGYGVTLRIYSEWGKIRIRKLRIRTIFTYFQLHRINRQDVLRPGSDTNSFNMFKNILLQNTFGRLHLYFWKNLCNSLMGTEKPKQNLNQFTSYQSYTSHCSKLLDL